MQTHPRVSLSTLSQWNWTIEENLDFFDREGVTAIGLSWGKFAECGGWRPYVDRIRDGGYRVTNLVALAPIPLADPSAWSEPLDRVRDTFDAAEALGAECLIMTTGPGGGLTWEDARDAYGEAMGALIVEEAIPRGIRIALEHTNSLRTDIGILHSLHDAVDFARQFGVGVCMEINACWAERGLGATLLDGADTLRIVQLSDFATGTLSTPNRLVPGDGDIPMRRIVSQLLAAGYGGVFDLEMIGPRIEEEGYASASTRGVEYVGGLLAALGA